MAEKNRTIVVDARFKSCPGPIIDLSEAAKRATSGQVLRLLATDPAAPSDASEWAEEVGHRIVKTSERNGVYEIEVEVR